MCRQLPLLLLLLFSPHNNKGECCAGEYGECGVVGAGDEEGLGVTDAESLKQDDS